MDAIETIHSTYGRVNFIVCAALEPKELRQCPWKPLSVRTGETKGRAS